MNLTSDERQQKLAAYATAHDQLRAAYARYPREMWTYRPAPDQWTLHEIFIHITDSEVSSYFRCRRLIAEPGSTVPGYDENRWARDLNYHDQSVEDAVELFRWLRHKSYALVKDLPDETWSNTVTHGEDGRITLDKWLDTYERHVRDHIEQMEEVYDQWQKTTNRNQGTEND